MSVSTFQAVYAKPMPSPANGMPFVPIAIRGLAS